MSLFASNPFSVLKAETLFRQQYRAEEGEQPDEFGRVGDAPSQPVPAGEGKKCPPCMKPEMKESVDEEGNRVEKYICVPACDTTKGEVCYIHPCLSGGWTCLKPQGVAGGGSRIFFPTNLTTTCGEEGYTGNGKACPCIVCNDTVSIANCRDDCRTCSQVDGATNIGQAANNRQLCGSSIGNVLVTGAGATQAVIRTPPSGTIWGFLPTEDVCQCPAGAQKILDPTTGRKKCANVGCTDPKADNYDPNATVACGEGTIWPNRCCTYPPYVPSCDLSLRTDACNKHFTNGANMDCMTIGNANCDPICADSSATDYAGRRAESSAKSLKELFYYEESANYDWSASGKPLGDKERWSTMTSKLSPTRNQTQDSAQREALAKQAYDLFYKACTGCPEGQVWSEQYGMCAVAGCTNTRACNYNRSARVDDGSCEFGSCTGCMMTGADNYDPNATIPCSGVSGLPNDCCKKDACPDANSCQFDMWCAGPMRNSSNMTKCNTSACKSCKKGYKPASNGVCIRCLDDDEDEECNLGCSANENPTTNSVSTFTKSVANSILNANTAKVGGLSLLTWGVIGLVVGGVVAASAE